MPDAHLGRGATVGSVIPTLVPARRHVVVAVMGVDIGCGMAPAGTPSPEPARRTGIPALPRIPARAGTRAGRSVSTPSAVTRRREAAGHADDGGDDGAVGGARFDLLHELLIDLHAVDREAAQVVERRVAGAEIVDGDLHAHLAQAVQRGDRARRVLHGQALGDLQLEIARRQAGALQRRGDHLRQIAVLELARREIHGHAQARVAIASATPSPGGRPRAAPTRRSARSAASPRRSG